MSQPIKKAMTDFFSGTFVLQLLTIVFVAGGLVSVVKVQMVELSKRFDRMSERFEEMRKDQRKQGEDLAALKALVKRNRRLDDSDR